jgi:hypothetical protein
MRAAGTAEGDSPPKELPPIRNSNWVSSLSFGSPAFLYRRRAPVQSINAVAVPDIGPDHVLVLLQTVAAYVFQVLADERRTFTHKGESPA